MPLKTLDEIVITNDNDMANTMNNYFSSVFTIEQLNNVPQLDQYEGAIFDTFNFSTEEVQEKLQHLNIYKSTGPDMLHPLILRALDDYRINLLDLSHTYLIIQSKQELYLKTGNQQT